MTTAPMWQTPPPKPRTVTLSVEEATALSDEIAGLRESVRFWRIVYLTVSGEFLVAVAAAVWGWAR